MPLGSSWETHVIVPLFDSHLPCLLLIFNLVCFKHTLDIPLYTRHSVVHSTSHCAIDIPLYTRHPVVHSTSHCTLDIPLYTQQCSVKCYIFTLIVGSAQVLTLSEAKFKSLSAILVVNQNNTYCECETASYVRR